MKRKFISIIAILLVIITILSSVIAPVNAQGYHNITTNTYAIIALPEMTIYGDSNKNITADTLKKYLKECIQDSKILNVLYDIIDNSTTNGITNKESLIISIDSSNLNQETIDMLKNWVENLLTIETAYEDISDVDIFTVNAIKGRKKSFKLYVTRSNKISGYQIKYSKNKKFSKSKTIKVTNKKDTYTVKNLASKKTYYVKVRAYKYSKNKHKNIYGNWTTFTVKTK